MEDRRIRRTRENLERAIIELVLEHEYESITIQDITRHAGIGYRTFFRHYPDKATLFRNVLEKSMDEFQAAMVPVTSARAPEINGTILFRQVAQDSNRMLALLKSAEALVLMQEYNGKTFRDLFSEYSELQEPRIPVDIVINHVMTSVMGLIHWWLEHEMQPEPEEMGRIYAHLIMYPSRRILGGVTGDEEASWK